MENRSYTAGGQGYRFGFNGQERDDEVAGQGNTLAFDARVYDSRLGRWFSLDPLQKKFPHLSHYVFTRNNPIIYEDVGGTEERYAVLIKTDKGDIYMDKIADKEEVIFRVVETFNSVTATSSDIVTTVTIDLRTGIDVDNRYNIERTFPLRNTGSAAVVDQYNDAKSDLADLTSGYE